MVHMQVISLYRHEDDALGDEAGCSTQFLRGILSYTPNKDKHMDVMERHMKRHYRRQRKTNARFEILGDALCKFTSTTKSHQSNEC